MSTVVKVKKETARELAKVVGKLTIERRKRVTYDEAIRFLIEKKKRRPSPGLKELIKKSFPGASSEDFKEHAYEDI